MKQEMTQYERSDNYDATEIGERFVIINKGIGQAYGLIFQAVGAFLSGLVLPLLQGPVMTCVFLAYLPLLMCVIFLIGNRYKYHRFVALEAEKELLGYI